MKANIKKEIIKERKGKRIAESQTKEKEVEAGIKEAAPLLAFIHARERVATCCSISNTMVLH